MPTSPQNESYPSFGIALSQALEASLADACESSWTLSIPEQSQTKPIASGAAQQFSVTFEDGLSGECSIAISQSDIAALALKPATKSSGSTISVDGSDENADAFFAVLQRAAETLQQQLQQAGSTAQVGVSRSPQANVPEGLPLTILAETPSAKSTVTLSVYVEEALERALDQALSDSDSNASPSDGSSQENLKLVLDAELQVMLRFGQRKLSLREVLDLNSGSVVELDRQVDEPIELVLDGRVVALGEAVIIDGNYGMRITEVLHSVLR